METTTSSPARPLEPPALSLTLPIVEDIPAELGEFVRLYKYGFWNEADDFFQDVLADHICHFPVVAELIEFLVEQGNYKRLRLVLAKELPRRRGSVAVTTNGTEEKKLLEHYEAVAVLYTQFKIDALAKTMAEDYLDRLKNKDAMSDIEVCGSRTSLSFYTIR
ncbi:Hypothetical protein D9617_5g067680 [Elsinoe fawcettii]|nr:Hypothetical protein D9617_5g067680 [Elsinoe fawcettii]